MHFTTLSLLSLFWVPSLAQSPINVQWPDHNEKLNLSAPINLPYTYSRDETVRDLTQLDITFLWKNNETLEGVHFQPIIRNYNLTGGRGNALWNPSPLLQSLNEHGDFLADGKHHQFEVKFHEAFSEFGMIVYSEMYAVDPPEVVGDTNGVGQVVRPVSGMIGLGLGVAVMSIL